VGALGNVLSFVETRYSQQELDARIATAVSGVRSVDVQLLPLRSIFIAMARNAQRKAG